MTLNGEHIFRLQRPVANFLALLAGPVIGALIATAAYRRWSGPDGLALPTGSEPFLLTPLAFFACVAIMLGLFLWVTFWATPYEIAIDSEDRIRVRMLLRERLYERQAAIGTTDVLLIFRLLVAQDDRFLLLPEFITNEALCAILQRKAAEANELATPDK